MRIVVQWPRLGPYHLARLRAFHTFAVARGAEIIALETASDDALYDWRNEREDLPFRREQVFTGRVYERVPGPEMEREVTAALDRLDPHVAVAVSYSTPDARAVLRWCRERRRGAVMTTDSHAADAARVAWREAIKRRLVAAADAALVAGSPQRAYAVALGLDPEAVFTTAAAVDNAFFRRGADAARSNPTDARSLPGLGSSVPFFLSSGRFIERKGLPDLIRAYRFYRESTEAPWRLVLLGDGALRPEIERLATEAGGVTLAGFRQIEDLPAYYGLASAYVHPAHTDQWGLVVNEAMAAGLPVVISRGAGCAGDLIEEGANGWTVPSREVPALADALRRMSRPETDRTAMGARSQEIIDGYSPEAFAEGLWLACTTARSRADRPFPLTSRAVFSALRVAARSTSSFHSVEG